MKFGLIKKDIDCVQNVFKAFPQVSKVLIFGSRALNNYKKGSDIDLALQGKMSHSVILAIKSKLEEELSLPYFFDVVDYKTITSSPLKKHIDTYGKILYQA